MISLIRINLGVMGVIQFSEEMKMKLFKSTDFCDQMRQLYSNLVK